MAGGKRDFLDIDPARLDEEWREIPRLVRSYSEDIADAKHELAQAKARLDVEAAELSLKIRENPAAFDLPDKPTEAAIKARLTLSPRIQDSEKEINRAQHSLDILNARLAATLEKRRAIEGNVELLKIEYFNGSDPKTAAGKTLGDQQHRKTMGADIPARRKSRD